MENKGTIVLHTERLLLRPFKESDAEAMFANWANDPDVTQYLTWEPHGSVEVTRDLLRIWEEDSKQSDIYNWAIEYNGELMGNISLVNRVNAYQALGIVGYCMGKKWWGKGIMTEALQEVLRYCFEEVGLHRIEGTHAASNIGSSRVMEKCGLTYEGTKRQHQRLLSTGERVDIVVRGILKEDYDKMVKK